MATRSARIDKKKARPPLLDGDLAFFDQAYRYISVGANNLAVGVDAVKIR